MTRTPPEFTLPSAADAPRAAAVFAEIFFDELWRQGLAHVCICPGSRSTPLTLAATRQTGLCCTAHHDERSAAFFALGMARASGQAVAVIVTSGTAVANLLPAVVEASHGRVPLLLLSADRPAELRDWGGGQTIDQLHLFGRYVRRFVEVEIADRGPASLRYARALAARSLADCRGRPPGPVHLNWPLREPFWLDAPAAGEQPVDAPPPGPGTRVVTGEPGLSSSQLAPLRELVRHHERGLIVCGELACDAESTAAIARLAVLSGWPILADPLSQLRAGPEVRGAPVVAHADILLREPDFARTWRPELVLFLGGPPVSKVQRQWLEASRPRHWVLVDPDERWHDPGHRATLRVGAEPGLLARNLVRDWAPDLIRGGSWTRAFCSADAAVAAVLAALLDRDEALLEPRAAWELAAALPPGTLLYASSSMPVRDLDAFLPRRAEPLRVLCNRGANGIDGVLSSALGAAASGVAPVVLLIGDIALLHDIGALLAARRYRPDLTMLVLNNDGGGIFAALPVAGAGADGDYDEFFRLPHGLTFAAAAALYGIEYHAVRSWADYRAGLAGVVRGAGPRLLELVIDADANRAHVAALMQAGAAAVAGAA